MKLQRCRHSPIIGMVLFLGFFQIQCVRSPVTQLKIGDLVKEGSGALSSSLVAIKRDEYGTPVIEALTDQAALFGLGYAAAQDRFFQMSYERLVGQGRTAEFLGRGEDDAYLKNDISKRVHGYSRYAQQAYDLAGIEVQELLGAYAAGVNAYVQSEGAIFHSNFSTFEIPVEPWKPEHSILAWTMMALRFSGDPYKEAYTHQNGLVKDREVYDDSAASVTAANITEEWKTEVAETAAACGYTSEVQSLTGMNGETVKFSNAVAISAEKSSLGVPMLMGDPRAPIGRPSAFWEVEIRGGTFNFRGAGPVGAIAFMVGQTDFVAWSPEAAGADHDDLFYLKFSDSQGTACAANEYALDGTCVQYEVDENEEILIKGQVSHFERYRMTHWGPVITSAIEDATEEYAIKSIALNRPDLDAVHGFLAMLRSKSIFEFDAALEKWRQPATNIVFAGVGGIGYRLKGPIPIRYAQFETAGKVAMDGSLTANDWCGMIPHSQLPHVLNPVEGYVFNANHMPIDSTYPLRLGIMTGGRGDTHRSRRLREIVTSQAVFTPDDLNKFHEDSVMVSRRDVAGLAAYLISIENLLATEAKLSLEAKSIVENYLEPWLTSGGTMAAEHVGVVVAHFINVLFRGEAFDIPSTYLECVYGGGENGMNFWLKTKINEMGTNPLLSDVAVPDSECFGGSFDPSIEEYQYSTSAYVDRLIKEAYTLAQVSAGLDDSLWLEWYRQNVVTFKIPAWSVMREDLPPLVPEDELSVGPVLTNDPDTIFHASSQIYGLRYVQGHPQFTQTLLPLGISEHPGTTQTNQMTLLLNAQMKGLTAVQTQTVLEYK